MKGASYLRQRSEDVTIIVVRVIGVLSFLIVLIFGGDFLWCLLAPFITIGVFYPFLIPMRNAIGNKKMKINLNSFLNRFLKKKQVIKKKFLIIELPVLLMEFPFLILGSYIFDVGKIVVMGVMIINLDSSSGFLTHLFSILTIAMVINFFASLAVWHFGWKKRVQYNK